MSEEKIISQGNIMHDSLEVIEYVVGDDSMSQGTTSLSLQNRDK